MRGWRGAPSNAGVVDHALGAWQARLCRPGAQAPRLAFPTTNLIGLHANAAALDHVARLVQLLGRDGAKLSREKLLQHVCNQAAKGGLVQEVRRNSRHRISSGQGCSPHLEFGQQVRCEGLAQGDLVGTRAGQCFFKRARLPPATGVRPSAEHPPCAPTAGSGTRARLALRVRQQHTVRVRKAWHVECFIHGHRLPPKGWPQQCTACAVDAPMLCALLTGSPSCSWFRPCSYSAWPAAGQVGAREVGWRSSASGSKCAHSRGLTRGGAHATPPPPAPAARLLASSATLLLRV